MGQARLLDPYAGPGEALLELPGKRRRDLDAPAAKRDLVGIAVVVQVAACDVPDAGFALDANVAVVAVHVEDRLGGVLDSPDDDDRNLDRIAPLVIHLELFPVQVAHAQ